MVRKMSKKEELFMEKVSSKKLCVRESVDKIKQKMALFLLRGHLGFKIYYQ